MGHDELDVDEIFFAALERATDEERSAYLGEMCGDDSEMRGRVERLLSARSRVDSFLEQPAPGVGVQAYQDDIDFSGTQIGPYKLLERIGEGGMGTVYMAEQSKPVQRKVALKIIKPGMDTQQVVARFEAERQALAMLNHPNIAAVYDAGTTESGRPYFVMELVKGRPITQFCDEHQLPPRRRLELFQRVCHAVQHAHQKGIIHRDLKPSNVMVAMYDDRPVPKVIDFGVAKATGERLTDKTLFTHFGQVIGTLEYMSPEQAHLNQLDVDTRSDIYSLGAILYELLTGAPPFEKERLQKGALDEVLRMIREDEPAKPSTKVTTGGTLPRIAGNKSEPGKLSALIRGDLDWIVMKALDKDRTRRYGTANGLAADIQRHLDTEPVIASPPSALYRFRKLVRRNRAVSAAAVAVATTLIIGLVVATIGFFAAVQARNLEREARRAAEMQHAAAEAAYKEAPSQRDEAVTQRNMATE